MNARRMELEQRRAYVSKTIAQVVKIEQEQIVVGTLSAKKTLYILQVACIMFWINAVCLRQLLLGAPVAKR